MGPVFARCQQTVGTDCPEPVAKCEAVIEPRICLARMACDFAGKYAVTRWLRNSEYEEVRPLPGKPTRATVKERS